MSQHEKMMLAILSGTQDKNISFSEEIINIQPVGKLAKSYQVKQVRQTILKYRLGGAINEV